MRWIVTTIALVLCTHSIWSQDRTQPHSVASSSTWRHAIGIDITSLLGSYRGVSLTYVGRANSRLFATADIKLILESDPIVRGTEAEIGLGYLIGDVVYPKLGVFYHKSTMQEDPIISRVSNAFFEELELEQKRRAYGGVIGLGALLPISKNASFLIEYGAQLGTEVIDQKTVEGDFTYVVEQNIDNRYVFNTESEFRQSITNLTTDITLLVTF